MNATLSGSKKQNLLNVALFAGIFEWYEFSIYGLLAGTIGQLFFESNQSITASLSAFMLFAFSYFARPLGGLFFGRMGDKIGRSHALKKSLLMMALPTALIGLLPTYEQGGILATILLCILRLMQGFGVGGEFPNSISYVFDAAAPRYRTLYCSITCASSSIGILLGSSVISLLNFYFDKATILNWAWRLPFLLGIPLTLYIAYMRRTIVEPEQPIIKKPLDQTLIKRLITERYNILTVILVGGMLTLCSNLFLIWMPFYLINFLGLSPQLAYFANTFTLVFEISVLILSGYAVYFIGAQRLLKILHISLLLLIYPLFTGLQINSYISLFMILATFAFLLGSINGCFLEIMGRLLPYDIRSLITSVVFAVSPAIFGGTAPVICTYITAKTGFLAAPSLYILAFGLIVLPFVLRLKLDPSTQPK